MNSDNNSFEFVSTSKTNNFTNCLDNTTVHKEGIDLGTNSDNNSFEFVSTSKTNNFTNCLDNTTVHEHSIELGKNSDNNSFGFVSTSKSNNFIDCLDSTPVQKEVIDLVTNSDNNSFEFVTTSKTNNFTECLDSTTVHKEGIELGRKSVQEPSTFQCCLEESLSNDDISVDVTDQKEVVEVRKLTVDDCTKFNWIYDLKQTHPIQSFDQQALVVLRVNNKSILTHDWNTLRYMNKEEIKDELKEILVIPRSPLGQMYILNGLNKSPHFALSLVGCTVLKYFCQEMQVPYKKISNLVQDLTHTNIADIGDYFVKSVNANMITKKEQGYMNHMKKVGKLVIPMFFSSRSNPKQDRVKYCVNLGLTNRKVDQLERITVTGRCGLNLIQTSTTTHELSHDLLKSIGSLLVYILNYNIPSKVIHSIFKPSSSYEIKYLRQFAKQLIITDDNDISQFIFPALSLLINNDVDPHYDIMNPVESKLDWTMSLSCQVPVKILPKQHYGRAKAEFGNNVPLCLVIYRRKAVEYLSKRMMRIKYYSNSYCMEQKGRILLVKLLSDVNSKSDYIGNFFNVNTRSKIANMFEVNSRFNFQDKILICPESVDKMVSMLCHIYKWYNKRTFLTLTMLLLINYRGTGHHSCMSIT